MALNVPRGYLVDTNVVSNRKDVESNPNLVIWFRRYAALVRISVVTLAEMSRGLILMDGKMAS